MGFKAIRGDIVHAPSKESLEINPDSYIVSDGKNIIGVFSEIPEAYGGIEIIDHEGCLVMPGFADLHTHGPQYANLGLGLDMELLSWLEARTFPEEIRFNDIEYADRIYRQFVRDMVREGTLNAVVFGTVFLESTLHLMEILESSGIRAYAGKVNMDRNTVKGMTEDTRKSLADTEEMIRRFEGNDRVRTILTPRFIPTCSDELLSGLGRLAEKYGIPVQSHLNETLSEIEWVKELYPDSRSYAGIYEDFGLFGQTPTIMAHCIYNSEEELMMMKSGNFFAAHCPDSNSNLSSGIMPLRRFLDLGIKVGIGSDISGGDTLSIRQCIVSAIKCSKLKHAETDESVMPVTLSEVFYLATRGGGEFFGNTGSFEKGFTLDCIVVDDRELHPSEMPGIDERLQKFIYCGSYRNIIARYVEGNPVDPEKVMEKGLTGEGNARG
jgi:guanine deaminase